ncbi:hypothetical protein QR680_013206 [Steinernema hermaphroditum]|uniref:WH1 domain-containing protein n=1 Tax=Steinernema hermaphroditum TaxID=289476 RepID=A0AA39I708_9BILA|nr:hypothetical protein QR680_013206 [Steinernema hermaphroditum]
MSPDPVAASGSQKTLGSSGSSDSERRDDRENVGSRLLDTEENNRVFQAIGADSRALCAGLARLLTVERGIGWDPLLFGVVCFVRNMRRKTTSVSFVSPGDFDPRNPETPHVMIDIPIRPEAAFSHLTEQFLVFESEGDGYGIEFVDEEEAAAFLQTVEFAQNVRRQNAERHKEAKDESSSSCFESSSSVAGSTDRLAPKRAISLVVPLPGLLRHSPVEFPPPPKPKKELRCSFHRHDAITPPSPKPNLRIARFSSQKFVAAPRDRRDKGRQRFFAT